MEKEKNFKKRRFNISKKLVRVLTSKQLLMLLPSIIDKLVIDNIQKSEDNTDTENSTEIEYGEQLNRKSSSNHTDTSPSNCLTTSTSITEKRNIYQNYNYIFIQKESVKAVESIILSKITKEIMLKLSKYADKFAKKISQTFSELEEVSISISDLDSTILKNKLALRNEYSSEIANNSHVLQLTKETLQNMKNGKTDLETLLLKSKIENIYINNEYVENLNNQKYTFLQISLHKCKRRYYPKITNKLEINLSYQRKFTNEQFYKDNLTNQVKSGFRNATLFGVPKHTHSVMVPVDTSDEFDFIGDNTTVEEKGIGNNNVTFIDPVNNIGIINQKGDTNIFQNDEFSKIIMDLKTELSPTINNNKCPIVFSTISEDDIKQLNTENSILCVTETEKKLKSHKKNNFKKTIPKNCFSENNKLKSIQQSNSLTKFNDIPKSDKFLKVSKKVIGSSMSKIVSGRLRYGWQCTYRECLTFNTCQRATCANCFNQRWCRPYKSKRDVICVDCGYVNYKSRLYCKKCKFIFLKTSSMMFWRRKCF